jgi:hypothetical protein
MMRWSRCCVVAAVLLLSGCNSNNRPNEAKAHDEEEDELAKAMQSWVGSHYSELLKSWGSPDVRQEDGKGGMILTWVKVLAVPGFPVIRQKREFFTNSEGIIYYWRYGPG